MHRELPCGVVTFLFTDIEGSTALLYELGTERYAAELVKHHELIREVTADVGGLEFATAGDAFALVFEVPRDAITAAERIQAQLSGALVRVRMGVHTGEVLVVNGDYVGIEVHKAARICSAAHGGQVLVSAQTRDLAGVSLRDLGAHRLKDLVAPVRLFQVGEGEFPPPRALKPTNLPVQPTPLLGREEELATLLALARCQRLVTLTGPGGTGKTRLALELAAELADDHADGVWWVPLAAVSDPALVLPTIAQVLGARGDVAEHLAGKRLLVLLDNLEQVLDAAAVIGELLSAAPGLRVIATSRERLGLLAEQEYPVGPLEDGAACELFITRARQVKPDFEPDGAVLEICRRLDRLPLALELAATRVKLMPADQILTRLERRLGLLTGGLRGLPERQSTMRAAIDWSYDLLSANERQVLRGLGVFADSFDLDAAVAVCHAELDELQSLVDKSLLRQRSDGRFFLLETTREYALDRLEEAAETAQLRRRHADWFLQLATPAGEGLQSHQQGVWLDRLRLDNDNLRAALAWTLEHDVYRGVGLAATLFRPWYMRGQLPELIGWFERALAQPAALDAKARATALTTFGTALLFGQQHDRAERVLDEGLAQFRSNGDELGEATALNRLGSVASNTGAVERAIELHERALAIFRRLDHQTGIARSLHRLGDDLRDVGDFDRAVAMLEEAVAIDTQLGDRYAVMLSLHSLGDAALDQGSVAAAARRYREALAICVELADELTQAYCVAGLACVAALSADSHDAGRLWAVAEGLERRIGRRMLDHERARYERILAALEHDAEYTTGRATGEGLPLENVVRELR